MICSPTHFFQIRSAFGTRFSGVFGTHFPVWVFYSNGSIHLFTQLTTLFIIITAIRYTAVYLNKSYLIEK